jgi:hypothetical protein
MRSITAAARFPTATMRASNKTTRTLQKKEKPRELTLAAFLFLIQTFSQQSVIGVQWTENLSTEHR